MATEAQTETNAGWMDDTETQSSKQTQAGILQQTDTEKVTPNQWN